VLMIQHVPECLSRLNFEAFSVEVEDSCEMSSFTRMLLECGFVNSFV
jgi:hypothetical protein